MDFENKLRYKGTRIPCFDQDRNPLVGKMYVFLTTSERSSCEYFVRAGSIYCLL